MKKRLFALGLSLILAGSVLTGCGSNISKDAVDTSVDIKDETKQTSEIKLSFDDEGYAEVSENDNYKLSVLKDGSAIRVFDKTTGKVWDSSASSIIFAEDFANAQPVDASTLAPEDVPEYGINLKWQKKLKSPFELFYTNLETGFGSVINLSLLETKYEAEFKKIDNGVRVIYDIKTADIKLAIDYSIGDKGLVVEVPQECIEEKGDYSLTSLKMLPYFGDALDTNNGFYFYPDGSGAIMEFKDSAHYLESELSMNIYGNLQNYKNTLDILAEDDPEVMLPVFGASINDNGFLAVVEEGQEAAKIKVCPTNTVIPVNCIDCEFQFRRSFNDARAVGKGTIVFDKKIISSNRRISYIFLEKGKSSYSDMAVAYRNYLMDNGIVKEKNKESNIPLSLDLFMGINEDGMIGDSYKSVTTFAQSEEILKKLKKDGVNSIQLQYKGWTKNGYFTDPDMFPINSKLGGSKGLKKVIEYAHNNDIKVSLEANFLEARASSKKFNPRNDVVYIGNGTIFTNFNNSLFLISPTAAGKNVETYMDKTEKFDLDGVSLYSLGQYVSYNYNSTDYITQAEGTQIWQNILEGFKKSKGDDFLVSVQGGNSYVLGKTDKITDLTYKDSGYQLTTKSVPFYQIAVHGLVDYSGKAANLSSDITKEKLKWVELGYIPYFELTYSGSEDLMYTSYSQLFSSEYQNWLKEASDIYKEMNSNLKDVWNALIINHEEISSNVFKVTYDNGKCVYVNYNNEDAVVDGVTVKALSYEIK